MLRSAAITTAFVSFFFAGGSVVIAEKMKTPVGDEAGMVYIPAGEFIRGQAEGDPLGFVWATPRSKVSLTAYYIDRHEVTNAEYKRFVDATGRSVPYDEKYGTFYNWEEGKYLRNFDDHPVVLVDWNDAAAYCKWVGKRLPTEAEWEKAARGTDGRLWPWGNEFDRFKANTRDFGVEMTMPAGSFLDGASPYGVMDMAGSVFEWVEDWYMAYPGSKRIHPDYGERYKVTRGGAWTSRADPYAYTMSRTAQPPDYKHRSIGFRCAKTAK